jgi:hypothetical protein
MSQYKLDITVVPEFHPLYELLVIGLEFRGNSQIALISLLEISEFTFIIVGHRQVYLGLIYLTGEGNDMLKNL